MALVQEKSDRITRRDPNSIEAAVAALAAKFGNRLVTSRRCASSTPTQRAGSPTSRPTQWSSRRRRRRAGHRAHLRQAARPVIPFGTGTSLEGTSMRPMAGVSIDFRDMNRVLAVNAQDLDCVKEQP